MSLLFHLIKACLTEGYWDGNLQGKVFHFCRKLLKFSGLAVSFMGSSLNKGGDRMTRLVCLFTQFVHTSNYKSHIGSNIALSMYLPHSVNVYRELHDFKQNANDCMFGNQCSEKRGLTIY